MFAHKDKEEKFWWRLIIAEIKKAKRKDNIGLFGWEGYIFDWANYVVLSIVVTSLVDAVWVEIQ